MFSVAVKNKRWVSSEFNNCMKTNAQKIKLCQIKKPAQIGTGFVEICGGILIQWNGTGQNQWWLCFQ
jgi:transcription elongation factor Elf1